MTSNGKQASRDQPRSSSARRSQLKGLLLVAAAAVLWGLLGPVARLAFQEGVEPLELGFWRALIAGVLCAAVAVGDGQARIRPRDAPGIVGFGIAGVAFLFSAYFFAVAYTGAALAAILLYTAPAWVAISSFLWLRERLRVRATAAVVLTIAGVAVVTLAGSRAMLNLPGIIWGLLAGMAYALYYLVGRHYFARYGTVTVLAYALPIGALALLPLVSFQPKSAAAWQVILFIAIVPTFAAALLYGAGVVRVAATRGATVAAIEPVVAAAVAFAFWGERFAAGGYLGAALVLAAVFLTASARERRVSGD